LGFLNSFFDRIYTRSKCEKLLRYQDRSFEFSNFGLEFPSIKISFGFKTELKTIETAGESAKALDDFQYQLCKDLENKTLEEQLDKPTWIKYIKTRFAANALVLAFRQTLEAFKNDPERQARNLDKIVDDIQKLVRSLSNDINQAYDTQEGRDAISSAIFASNITEGEQKIEEHEIDQVLLSKFKEFEETQSKILEKIINVEKTFKESQIKFNLLQSNIELYTSESKIRSGNSDCWIRGYFKDGDIKSGYDARRPITDKIIESVEKNDGTIVYGDPYTGKSVLLKRIIFELIQKGYIVLFGDNNNIQPSLLRELLNALSQKYDKIVLITDNIHKSASESIFRVFNEIEADKIKFLFAGREKQLNKDRPEINLALTEIPNEAQYRIDFTKDDAMLLFSKAIEVVFQESLTTNVIDHANNLYNYSHGDPLMFNLGLRYTLRGGRENLENFIQIEMDNWINKIEELKNHNIWNAAIFASLLGIPDLSLNLSESTNILDCSDFDLDDLRFLARENILLKEDTYDVFRIKHEQFSYEFLSRFYKQKFNNSQNKFDQNYNITNVIKCIWRNVNADTTIDILNTCSYLYEINRYNPISRLITSTCIVPANSYIAPSHFTENDKIKVFCYGLSKFFYYSLKDYQNALAYCEKALALDSKNIVALGNKGGILIELGKYEEAITFIDKALAIDENNAINLGNKGLVLDRLGKYEEAIIWFDKALAIDENNAINLGNKGGVLLELGKYEEAITFIDRSLELDKEYVTALGNKGLVFYRTGKFEEAIIWFDKSLAIDSKNIVALYNKGLALIRISKYEEAINYFDKVLEIDENNASALRSKGLSLFEIGKYEEAIIWFDKSLAIDSKNIVALGNKGITLFEIGKYEEAINYFDKVLEIDENNDIAIHYNKLAHNKLDKD
jgi:tetratricopeptide (TPR) repeat protein